MTYSLRKKITAVVKAFLLAPIVFSGPISDISAEKALVSTGSPYYNKIKAPTLKPVWSTPMAIVKDNPAYQTVTTISENGKVFVLQRNKKLIALKASTGVTIWEFGSDLALLFTYSNNSIYGLTKGGSLYAVSEGVKKFGALHCHYLNASSIQRIGSTIYVTEDTQLAAVDANSGKIKWKIADNSNNFTGLVELSEVDGLNTGILKGERLYKWTSEIRFLELFSRRKTS